MGYYEAKQERDRALLRAVGHIKDEALPAKPQGLPNFDGGVREPVPPPSDPVAEHGALVAELLRAKRLGGRS